LASSLVITTTDRLKGNKQVAGDCRIDSGAIVVLDSETTGLRCRLSGAGALRDDDIVYDEILQLAIVDATGAPLFYDSFSPVRHKSWAQAQRIHGIAPRNLKGKAPFSSRKAEVQSIINDADLIVAYNADFDLGFLSAQGIKLKGMRFACLMKEFARVHGRKRGHRTRCIWQTLEACAQYYGIAYPLTHDVLADARVTLRCHQSLMQESGYRMCVKEWSIR
jgi:DNA polymerase-3 subunit epsilon